MSDKDSRATFDNAIMTDELQFKIKPNVFNVHNIRTDLYAPVKVCRKCYAIYMTLRPRIMSLTKRSKSFISFPFKLNPLGKRHK